MIERRNLNDWDTEEREEEGKGKEGKS